MLNNPFCYTPRLSIQEAARSLISRIDNSPYLRELFSEGKMLGVLEVEPIDDERAPLALASVCSGEKKPSHPDTTRRCALIEASDAAGGVRRSDLFSGARRTPEQQSERPTMYLYAFSGLAGGQSVVEGFVPPIFAWKPEDIIGKTPDESRRLQEWLFDQYVVVNGHGEKRSIRQIFADRGLVPPGGTGDCAAPKLLQYALSHGLKPLSIGEFWYGASPEREVRRSGAFYPACTGKCGPLLGYMLQGVDVEPNPLESDAHWEIGEPIVRYEDRDIIVAEKPAGMLAVPGRPVEGVPPRLCLQKWLEDYTSSEIYSCHRLDMDTSGLMVFAKSPAAQAAIQQQFEKRLVTKAYLARVGPAEPSGKDLREGDKGTIALPLAPDWYDRPRQMVDTENGKPAVTGYEVLRVDAEGCAFLRLTPFTGRTHQLRVHCAHEGGLGRPMEGDRLYGGRQAPRLMLHASYLSFHHPDGRRMTFESDFNHSV